MNTKEQVIALLDTLPAYKMGYVLAYVHGITADEEADDHFCQKILEDYKNDPDQDKNQTYMLEECKKEWGFSMYQIRIQKRAKKFIDKLPQNEKLRIVQAIEALPDGEDIKKLKGHDDLLRLRVGDYRIIFSVITIKEESS